MKRVLSGVCALVLLLAGEASGVMVSLVKTGPEIIIQSYRPTDPSSNPANFVITARTKIDYSQPFIANTTGNVGTVYLGTDGAGVKKLDGGGSKGISGGGGDKDEELIFTYDNAVRLDSIQLIINQLDFGNGVGDQDDPVIFLDLADGTMYEWTILESEIKAAFSFTGSAIGVLDFAGFTSLAGNTAIKGVKFRETNGHTFLTGFSTGILFTPEPPPIGPPPPPGPPSDPPIVPQGIAPVPEPATIAMLAVGAVFVGRRFGRKSRAENARI